MNLALVACLEIAPVSGGLRGGGYSQIGAVTCSGPRPWRYACPKTWLDIMDRSGLN